MIDKDFLNVFYKFCQQRCRQTGENSIGSARGFILQLIKLYWHCYWICLTFVKIKFSSILYFTRLIKMDRVGFEELRSLSIAVP
jgi:hypothetical protein